MGKSVELMARDIDIIAIRNLLSSSCCVLGMTLNGTSVCLAVLT